TIDKSFKTKFEKIKKVWKIKPPEKLIRIKTTRGKEIFVTKNTPLLTIENGRIVWKRAGYINLGEYVATSRKLPEFNGNLIILLIYLMMKIY
ncbi:MAG: Hint domain-containing protein, partial [Candidatus Altarchaeaceae archaeon]